MTPVEQGRIEAHAAACAACAAELEEARGLVKGLRALPPVTCPDTVSQALHARILRTRQDRLPTAARRWFAPLAAAAVLALIAGRLLFDPAPVPPTLSPGEIAQARRQVEWTLAYLSDLNCRVGAAVRDDVIHPHLVEPLRFDLETILRVQNM